MALPPPLISDQLVAWLEVLFPNKCPRPDDSERAIWMAVGAQTVIDKLRHEAARQFNPEEQ